MARNGELGSGLAFCLHELMQRNQSAYPKHRQPEHAGDGRHGDAALRVGSIKTFFARCGLRKPVLQRPGGK